MASPRSAQSRGLVFGTSAFLIWGLLLPAFMKALWHVSALEIVAQRIVWAVPCAAAILWWLGGLRGMLPAFSSPRTLALAATTATIISINWGLYTWAVLTNHILDAALGYYVNPLVNVVLGAVFLGERPTRLQGIAIAFAVLAVAILTLQAGGLPWISLVLAFSFATYGLLRKVLPIGPTEGFFLEVLILSIPCLAYIGWTFTQGTNRFATDGVDTLLLMASGPMTAVPLILFAAAAKLLDYSTVGILQYIAPTALFFTAVFVYGEPFSGWQLVAFALIWTAVAIYVASLLKDAKERRRRQADEAMCPT